MSQPPRNIAQARAILERDQGPRLNLMEVCGTHTAAIAQSGLRALLPSSIRLVSGPGCPVCVTPSSYIDRLCELARLPGHKVLCFGDLIRVPGRLGSLAQAMALGGQVQMIYSPLDALEICRSNPDSIVILAAVGFETTAPSYALLVQRALKGSVRNLRLLTALRRMPPALDMLCASGSGIDGFLAPGHVSAIIGSKAYEPYAIKYLKPFVVAGFGPEDVLGGISRLVQLCRREPKARGIVENAYPSVVRPEGNPLAQAVLAEVFAYEDAAWRGLGVLPESGYRLKGPYAQFDAGPLDAAVEIELPGCRCGELLLGKMEPEDCPLFGQVCQPQHPVGPCMVSTEGACGIHYRFLNKRHA